MSGLRRWRSLGHPFAGVRARSAVAAVVVVAIALALGATLLVVLLNHTLVSTVDTAATARAKEVATQLKADGPSGFGDYLVENNRLGQVVQVLNSRGRRVASSSGKTHQRPISAVRPGAGEVLHQQVAALPALNDDDPYLVVIRGATHGGAGYTVVVASPLKAQRDSVSTVKKYLLAGLAPLLFLVGAATWVLVGRSLAPVERIRARVQGITAARLQDRVPEPTTHDEIARLAVTMNQMLGRLDAAHNTQRRFVADASHELRSPLATLTAGLEVAAADPSGRAWQELHPMMASEAARMQRLVQDLLLLAKADDNRLLHQRGDVDLDDLLYAESRRLTVSSVEVDTDITPVRVIGDAAKLSQVLRNLTDNAAREAHHRIRLSLSQEQDAAVVVIEDDGPGVPPEQRQRIFERFVRLDESRERGRGGSGLGLAIVTELVHGHGGTISVSDSSLGGAKFELRLPVSSPAPVPQHAANQERR